MLRLVNQAMSIKCQKIQISTDIENNQSCKEPAWKRTKLYFAPTYSETDGQRCQENHLWMTVGRLAENESI